MFLDVEISFLQQAVTISARDLVARPEEAWASLACYCGLDPTNAKPLEAHKKLALASKHYFKTKSELLHLNISSLKPNLTFAGILSEGHFSVVGFSDQPGRSTKLGSKTWTSEYWSIF